MNERSAVIHVPSAMLPELHALREQTTLEMRRSCDLAKVWQLYQRLQYLNACIDRAQTMEVGQREIRLDSRVQL